MEELIKTKTEECEDYKDSQEYEFEKRRLEEYKYIVTDPLYTSILLREEVIIWLIFILMITLI